MGSKSPGASLEVCPAGVTKRPVVKVVNGAGGN